jgi:transposase
VAKLPELGTLSRSKIAALCGVAPYNKDSGKSVHGVRITKGGRHVVRTILFLAAMNAVRTSTYFKTFYQRLVQRGKKKMVALIAVMRKIIIMLNSMVAKQTLFNKQSAFQQMYAEKTTISASC